MSNTTTSPNMNLPVPVVSVDPGPDWATNYDACLNAIDSHNHSAGQGVQITPSGININAALPMNGNNLTTIRSANFTAQGSPLSLPADVGCLYVSGVDLYYNDENGNQVRITQSGSVNGSTGTITGLPSGTASASFAAGTFSFQSATSTPATMSVGPIVTGAQIASPKTVTISASAVQPSNYALTWPTAQGAANSIISNDGSGNLAFSAIGTILSSANIGQVLSSNISAVTATLNSTATMATLNITAGTWIIMGVATALIGTQPGSGQSSTGWDLFNSSDSIAISSVQGILLNNAGTLLTPENVALNCVGYLQNASTKTVLFRLRNDTVTGTPTGATFTSASSSVPQFFAIKLQV